LKLEIFKQLKLKIKGAILMTVYKYVFEDGYFCYTYGKLSRIDLKHEIAEHGKVISMTVE
jgi:hypothetical protein